ncbi:MAG: Arylesterase precursor, partial [uncultured Sphingomonadaceae bacterium]
GVQGCCIWGRVSPCLSGSVFDEHRAGASRARRRPRASARHPHPRLRRQPVRGVRPAVNPRFRAAIAGRAAPQRRARARHQRGRVRRHVDGRARAAGLDAGRAQGEARPGDRGAGRERPAARRAAGGDAGQYRRDPERAPEARPQGGGRGDARAAAGRADLPAGVQRPVPRFGREVRRATISVHPERGGGEPGAGAARQRPSQRGGRAADGDGNAPRGAGRAAEGV